MSARWTIGWAIAATALVGAAVGVRTRDASIWPPAAGVAAGDWTTINRDAAASRFSPLSEINTSNVAALEEAWRHTLTGGDTAVPLAVNGVLFVPSGDRVLALDGETGREVWSTGSLITAATGPLSSRGVGYWSGDNTHAPRVLFMAGNRLFAVDAASGRPSAGFGSHGAVEIGVPFGGVPTIFRNVAIVGAASGEDVRGPAGNPRAFDVVTGQKLWEFQTVPKPGERFNDTWGAGWRDRGGTNMWAFFAPIDTERGIAYLAISGPATNYYGGDRPGTNVYGNSIVAVDVMTGKYLWHFQTVHHDLWDFDMPSAGALFDFEQNGRRVPAIAHVGKSSYVFVLDRVTGKPLIPVEERRVPPGNVPGEWYSPTQPFPVRPGPLSRVSFDARTDLVTADDTTPAHAAACKAMMDGAGGYANAGPFAPFMYRPTGASPRSNIQIPGGLGGVNWGGMAMDPRSATFFVNVQNSTMVGWVEDKPPTPSARFEAGNSRHPYDRARPYRSFAAPLGGQHSSRGEAVGPMASCIRPPWSTLTAVNAATGVVLWRVPLGLTESLAPGKQLTGNSGNAGATVTAGNLVFVGATNDGRFRAFDARSGAQLWVAQLPVAASGTALNANANAMTYQSKSQKQFVAIVASPVLVVYALKR